jgi:hypothetical protein
VTVVFVPSVAMPGMFAACKIGFRIRVKRAFAAGGAEEVLRSSVLGRPFGILGLDFHLADRVNGFHDFLL